MKKYLLLFITLLLFIACKTGKDYQRPELDLPESFYVGKENDTLASVDNIVVPDSIFTGSLKWKEFFKDSLLISFIDTAIAHNLSLKKASYDIMIEMEGLRQAKLNRLPTVSGQAGYIREYFSENYYSSPASKYYTDEKAPSSLYTQKVQHFARVGASWEIDIWGKMGRQRELALAEYYETEESRKALQTYLVAEIAASYYKLLMLKSQLGIAKSNLELNNNTLEILKLQYDAGEITSLAVQQVQLQKLKAETFIPQIEKEYLQEEVYLNSLLGRFPESINIDFWIEEIQPETLYGAGIPLELLNNRPDIAASEYVLMAAYARAGIAQAMKYPSVTLNASVGLDAMFFQDMFNPLNSGLLWLSGSILQPIFQQGKLRANHNISLLQIEKAQLDFQQKMITAVGEVSNALIAVEKLKEEYRIGSERLEIAQQSVRSALLLFKSGLANYLEVLTAQSNALDSELNLANVKMKILMANVELYRSLGGGWE